MTKLIINEICKKQGITLTILSNKLGITKSSLSVKLKNGNLRLSSLEEIAKALNVEVVDLFATSETANQSSSATVICPHCSKSINLCVSVQ